MEALPRETIVDVLEARLREDMADDPDATGELEISPPGAASTTG